MLIPDRRRRVLDHVRRHGSASVGRLAADLGVSESTVRRDMIDLERQGLLARARGGAVELGGDLGDGTAAPTSVPAAGDELSGVKTRIGSRAAELVGEGSTIMVLSGSTTAAMVRALYHRKLTVVTNGLEIANALKHAPQISLVVLGGYLHREQMTLLGPMTLAAMAALHVETMVAGAWGVDAATGVTGNKIIQAGNHDEMLSHADRLVVLADSSKLGRRGPTMLAGLDKVHTIVTDSGAQPAQIAALRAAGVTVDVV